MTNNNKNHDCLHCVNRSNSFFCDLNEEAIKIYDGKMQFRSYLRKEYIFEEGEPILGLHCIYYGKVKLFKIGKHGKEFNIQLSKQGDLLGFITLFSEKCYSFSAIALEDTAVCIIPLPEFSQLYQSNNPLLLKLTTYMSNELIEKDRKMMLMKQGNVLQQIAFALIYIKDKIGYENFNTVLNITLLREEIGSIVGVNEEITVKMLKVLKDDRIIDFVEKRIKIIDYKKLLEIAA